MATPTIRSTYVLDLESLRALERIAQQWRVSKSEALRRAIRAAAGERTPEGEDALRTLDRLQRSLKLTPASAREWARKARRGRRQWSARSEARGR
jgi:hypothetical protein